MMMEILDIIKDIGFPIAIAVYLLVFQNKKIESLETALNNNTTVLNKLLIKLGVDDEDG